jgi:hypothetical protein
MWGLPPRRFAKGEPPVRRRGGQNKKEKEYEFEREFSSKPSPQYLDLGSSGHDGQKKAFHGRMARSYANPHCCAREK